MPRNVKILRITKKVPNWSFWQFYYYAYRIKLFLSRRLIQLFQLPCAWKESFKLQASHSRPFRYTSNHSSYIRRITFNSNHSTNRLFNWITRNVRHFCVSYTKNHSNQRWEKNFKLIAPTKQSREMLSRKSEPRVKISKTSQFHRASGREYRETQRKGIFPRATDTSRTDNSPWKIPPHGWEQFHLLKQWFHVVCT